MPLSCRGLLGAALLILLSLLPVGPEPASRAPAGAAASGWRDGAATFWRAPTRSATAAAAVPAAWVDAFDDEPDEDGLQASRRARPPGAGKGLAGPSRAAEPRAVARAGGHLSTGPPAA